MEEWIPRKQIDIDEILQAFLVQMPTRKQTEAAKMLKIPQKRFHDYYNHRYNPPEALLVKMECFLNACGVYLKKKSANSTAKLSHSERAKYVLADKQWGKKRSGRPKN